MHEIAAEALERGMLFHSLAINVAYSSLTTSIGEKDTRSAIISLSSTLAVCPIARRSLHFNLSIVASQ
jgi:hypothetical protein